MEDVLPTDSVLGVAPMADNSPSGGLALGDAKTIGTNEGSSPTRGFRTPGFLAVGVADAARGSASPATAVRPTYSGWLRSLGWTSGSSVAVFSSRIDRSPGTCATPTLTTGGSSLGAALEAGQKSSSIGKRPYARESLYVALR